MATDFKALLNKDIGGLPLWVWGIAGLGGIGLGYYFYSRAKAGSASTASATDTTPQDAGMGSYQAAGPNAGNTGTPGATINIGVPATPSNWLTSIILANHPVNEYASAGQPGGLPDAVIATIPANSTVQATGPEVVGAWNIPNGSELWYPVTYNGIPGFVSAYDVVNSSTTIGTQPVTPPTTTTTGKIRSKQTTGPFANYDKTHSGVPFYSQLGSTTKNTIPYDTSVTILQSGLTGPSTGSTGSKAYAKISWNTTQGYVNAQDLV